MPDRARTTWNDLLRRFPSGSRAKDARDAIAELPVQTAAPAPPAPH